MLGLKLSVLWILIWLPATAFSATLDMSDFELVFTDEFEGSSLDPQKWSTRHIWGSFVPINAEEQYYVDSLDFDKNFDFNPFVFTGTSLIIRADEITSALPAPEQPDENSVHWNSNSDFSYNPNYDPEYRKYLSGLISTYESFNFTHGYAETRAKIPAGKGLWSAFWLLTSKYVEDVPEIDIMEAIGEFENEVNHTLHYFDIDNNWQLISSPTYKTTGQNFTDSFHTYGVLWEPRKITWFVDGVAVREVTEDDFKIPKQSMYLIANLAVGGTWPGSPDSSTSFPADYELDYIKVYRKKPIQDITPAVLDNEYDQIFSDEFNDGILDSDKWNTSYLWGPFYRINNEHQYYLDKHARDKLHPLDPFEVSNGSLKITAEPVSEQDLPIQPEQNDPIWDIFRSHQYNPEYTQPGGWTPQYSSGVLTSYESFKFVHGYVEARIKVPQGGGLWPAFWLLNAYYVGPMPEIDIMELQGEAPGIVHHSYHYHDTTGMLNSSAQTSTLLNNESFADDFHTFGVQWDRNRITWYIDGKKTRTMEGPEVSTQLMYILLNLAVGGNFVGDVDHNSFPATLEVDYVRAYQRKPSALVDAPDTTVPVTSIIQPSTSNTVFTSSPLLSGTVFDDSLSPVKLLELNIRDIANHQWVKFDGTVGSSRSAVRHFLTPQTPVDGFAQWSTVTALPEGRYELYLRATDIAGNRSAWERSRFVVSTPDSTAPVTSITQPPTSNTVFSLSPHLSGTVFDDSLLPVKLLELNIRDIANHQWVRLDGTVGSSGSSVQQFLTPQTPVDGLAQWSIVTALPEGRYELYLRATDIAGNRSDWERSRVIVSAPDSTAPVTSITRPATSNTVFSSSPHLSGTVFDDSLLPVKLLELNIRDIANHQWVRLDGTVGSSGSSVQQFLTPQTPVDGLAQWSIVTALPEGRYELYLRATDIAGNRSDWERSRVIVSAPDSTAPVTSITRPATSNTVFSSSPHLSGTVFDDSLLSVTSLELNIRDIVNHQWVKLDGTVGTVRPSVRHFLTPQPPVDGLAQWTIDTALPDGRYELYLRATDASGNTSEWERTKLIVEF